MGSRKPQQGKSATPPQQVPQPHQPMVVLTTRMTAAERDRVRSAAGWGGLQRFVREAVLAAVERTRKPRR